MDNPKHTILYEDDSYRLVQIGSHVYLYRPATDVFENRYWVMARHWHHTIECAFVLHLLDNTTPNDALYVD